MRIFCFEYAFYSLHTSNLNAITAMGRSDIILKLEIIKKIMGVTVLVSTMWFGVMVMAYSQIVTGILSQLINAWPNRKLLNYKYSEQFKDMLPQIFLSLAMGAIVYCVSFLHLGDIATLCIQVPLGAAIYFGASWIFKLESFEYVLNMAKNFIKTKRG